MLEWNKVTAEQLHALLRLEKTFIFDHAKICCCSSTFDCSSAAFCFQSKQAKRTMQITGMCQFCCAFLCNFVVWHAKWKTCLEQKWIQNSWNNPLPPILTLFCKSDWHCKIFLCKQWKMWNNPVRAAKLTQKQKSVSVEKNGRDTRLFGCISVFEVGWNRALVVVKLCIGCDRLRRNTKKPTNILHCCAYFNWSRYHRLPKTRNEHRLSPATMWSQREKNLNIGGKVTIYILRPFLTYESLSHPIMQY